MPQHRSDGTAQSHNKKIHQHLKYLRANHAGSGALPQLFSALSITELPLALLDEGQLWGKAANEQEDFGARPLLNWLIYSPIVTAQFG